MISHSQIFISDLISRAINAGIRLGETFEIFLDDNRTYAVIGARPTQEFVNEWRSCFEGSKRKPRKNRAYIGISYCDGAYLIEI
jgi:hypothetical protein